MTSGQVNQLKGFDLIHQGKIRDIYRYKEEQILIITSDRISAFDFVFDDLIFGKGRILTSISKYWFRKTKNIINNHFIDKIPELDDSNIDRAMIAREAKVIPFEAIVRGNITGSAWNEYMSNQTIGGTKTKNKYKEFDDLETPLFTPTTKAKVGDKDIPVTFSQMRESLGERLANEIRECSIKLFQFARKSYLDKGIVLVDTKFEFGLDINNELILIDEIFTPDCSRFWLKEDVDKGFHHPYDKQIFRNYLLNNNWNNKQIKLSDEIKNKLINNYERIQRIVIDD